MSQLLSLAVKAPLPLVSIETDDPLNITKVLTEVLGTTILGVPKVKSATGGSSYNMEGMTKKGVYLMRKVKMDAVDWEKLYSKMVALESTLIITNPTVARPEIFNAGFVSCPESLIRKFVGDHSDMEPESDDFLSLVSALSGLSYQNMVQITLLAQANSGSFTARDVREVRRIFFGNVRGVQQESTDVPFYAPSEELLHWLALDGVLFAEGAPDALRARGLLLDGPPGTGKTMGAKALARQLGLPLYRLDIGATMNKYVGESEKGLDIALDQIDRCAPCVMLLDEVEKIFSFGSGGGDSGVSTRALSKLLWWLQEHKSRVLTVMTTNNKSKLPPELIRPGRIDKQFYLGPLDEAEGLEFMRQLAKNYEKLAVLSAADISKAHAALYTGTDTLHSHSHLTGVVMGMLKQQYLTAPKSKSKPKSKSTTPA